MSSSEEGRARRERTTFRLAYEVAITIAAPPQRVWEVLTDVPRIPAWNSTIEQIEGTIEPGSKVKLRVPIAPGREFELTVDEVDAPTRLVWSDGFMPMFRGVRTYTLDPVDGGRATRFRMEEILRGVMLPMIAGSLPDFREPFEAYARDLKREAEGPG